MPKLSGTIYHAETRERIAGASIKATTEKVQKPEFTTSDRNGNYDLDLDPGVWTIIAMSEKSFPGEAKEIDVMQDKPGVNYYLPRLAGTQDMKSGKVLFWVLFGILIALIITYIITHLFFPVGRAIAFVLWDKDPLRFLEIMFWGFGGILVNKLIMIGWWLRKQSFYREGIIMHISHLITTPVMVLVATILLSLVSIDVTLAGNQLTLDLSKPSILIAFAFILGTSPWPLWNFIEDAGKRFTRKDD